MNARVGDIIDPAETRGDLIARGLTDLDATTAIAFGVWLRRGGSEDAADGAWARSEISAQSYLEQVAPEELKR